LSFHIKPSTTMLIN